MGLQINNRGVIQQLSHTALKVHTSVICNTITTTNKTLPESRCSSRYLIAIVVKGSVVPDRWPKNGTGQRLAITVRFRVWRHIHFFRWQCRFLWPCIQRCKTGGSIFFFTVTGFMRLVTASSWSSTCSRQRLVVMARTERSISVRQSRAKIGVGSILWWTRLRALILTTLTTRARGLGAWTWALFVASSPMNRLPTFLIIYIRQKIIFLVHNHTSTVYCHKTNVYLKLYCVNCLLLTQQGKCVDNFCNNLPSSLKSSIFGTILIGSVRLDRSTSWVGSLSCTLYSLGWVWASGMLFPACWQATIPRTRSAQLLPCGCVLKKDYLLHL